MARARKKAKKTKKAKSARARRTKKAPTSKGGRPEIEFPDDCVESIKWFAALGNTIDDIAMLVGVSKSTLERRAADESHPVHAAIAWGKANRHNSLRAAQLKSAIAGNSYMQRWLGIQDLGQRDRKALEVSGPDGGPVEVGGGDMLELLAQKIHEVIRSQREVGVDLPGGA